MNRNSLIRIGHNNLVNGERIIAIVSPDSAPVRRMVQDARDRGALIDASSGKKTRSVLVMDSDQLILSALSPEQLEKQFFGDSTEHTAEELTE